jgi:hypothetical protein
MYAYVAAATGWTWEYIGEQLTLPRLYALMDHWKRYPPAHVTAALFAGIKPADEQSRAEVEAETDAFIDSMPTMRVPRPA